MKIPQLFHFIWAGGDKLLPDKNAIVILKWMDKHPGIDFWLWVDKDTQPSNIKNFTEYYQTHFAELAETHNLKIDPSRFKVKDITEEKVVDSFVRYEIDRLRPNYGASSDLLRYKILHEFGGAYFDSDVGIGKTSLVEAKLFEREYKEPVLIVDRHSQGTPNVGNDALLAPARIPQMEIGGAVARENYRATHSVELTDNKFKVNVKGEYGDIYPLVKRAYFYDNPFFIKEHTPKLTGPSIIRAIDKAYPKQCIDELPVDCRTPVPEIGKSWVFREVKKYNDINVAITDIIKSIKFELEQMHFLRLEDHLENLAEATKKPTSVVLQPLLTRLAKESLDFSRAQVVQNTFHHPEVIDFYEKILKIDKRKYCHFDIEHPKSNDELNYLQSLASIMGNPKLKVLVNTINPKEDEIERFPKGMLEPEEICEKILDIYRHAILFVDNELVKLEIKLAKLSVSKGLMLLLLEEYFTTLRDEIEKSRSFYKEFTTNIKTMHYTDDDEISGIVNKIEKEIKKFDKIQEKFDTISKLFKNSNKTETQNTSSNTSVFSKFLKKFP